MSAAKAEIPMGYSYTDMLLIELINITIRANSKKTPKRFPGIWEKTKNTISKGSLPADKAIAFFGRLGHKPTVGEPEINNER